MIPTPRTAAEWAVFLEDWATLPSGVSPQEMADMVCAYARQQVWGQDDREQHAMTTPRSLAEWAEIEARHVKVEDVIFDGPVCRTCRHIDGAAVSYPCDAAIVLAYARQQVEASLKGLVTVETDGDFLVLRGHLGRPGKAIIVVRSWGEIAAAIRALTL